MNTLAQPGFRIARYHRVGLGFFNLQHGTQLFAKQGRNGFRRITGQMIQGDIQTGTGSKRHFHQCGEQAAVGTIMVSQQFALSQQLLSHFEKGNQVFGIIQVRGNVTDLAVHLCESRASHTILATAQIQQQQLTLHASFQFRGHRQVDIGDRGKCRNHQRHGRSHTFIDALIVPHRTHG